MGKQDFRRFMRNKGRQGAPATASSAIVPTGQKVGVMFAVPSEDGRVHASIAFHIGRMMYNRDRPECPFRFDTHVVPGVRPIQFARNLIVDTFLASDAQWLIMVDDDQVVPENFWQLMTVSDADVVSGKTYCWVGNKYTAGRLRLNQYSLIKREEVEFPECYNVWEPAEAKGQPYRVPIVGTGCIAIRRHVLEALGPNCFQFSYKKNGSIMGGEDINFSQMCNQSGFVIAVHPGVRFGHVKSLDLAEVADWEEAHHAHRLTGKPHDPIDVLSIGA